MCTCFTAKPSSATTVSPPNALCQGHDGPWRVAFARGEGDDGVDQHLGSSVGFAIYDVTPEGIQYLGYRDMPAQRPEGHHGRLLHVMDVLQGCRAVYCVDVGPGAVQRLLEAGIQPVRVAHGSSTATLLAGVREVVSTHKDCRGHRTIHPERQGCERFMEILEHETWQP